MVYFCINKYRIKIFSEANLLAGDFTSNSIPYFYLQKKKEKKSTTGVGQVSGKNSPDWTTSF